MPGAHHLDNFAGAFGGGAGINFGGDAGGALVAFAHVDGKFFDLIGTDKVDRAAAEAAAGHACAEAAGEIVGQIRHDVQFLATYVVVVAQACVGFLH